MENYTYAASYPESGGSSPHSREIDYENPPPWEDQQQNYKVKFMCSYGGKIHPRPNDNQLSYIGGETKILAVDRNIKFSSLINKLSALCDSDNVSFKYQLPGEDLDALISVTNDDDLEHMMHEYDRLYKASPKPARLRLFLFPVNHRSFGSDDSKSDKERFVEALNSGPVVQTSPGVDVQSNVDFLFGLEKGMAPQVQQMKVRDHASDAPVVPGLDERITATDPIQKHIQDLQKLRLEEQQGLYRRKSEDSVDGGYSGGEYYSQKMPEKVIPMTVPGTGFLPAGYWPDKQVVGGVYQANTQGGEQQPVYIFPTPTSAYHAPMVRPMTGAAGQGYYAVQRMPPDGYRDPQVYNVMPNVPPPVSAVAAGQPTLTPQQPLKMAASAGYSEGVPVVRPTTIGGVGVVEAGGYTQLAYDGGVGRQVYYNTPGGIMAGPPQAQPAVHYQDGNKVVPKATQTSG